MTDLSRETRLSAPADEVWALVGAFDSLPNWHPAVLSCELGVEDDRMVRRLVVVGGIRVTERLLRHDDAERKYSYAISDGGRLPVADFTATFRVTDHGIDGTGVVWSCSFVTAGAPEDVAREAMRGILDSGLNALEDRFGKAG